MSEFTISTKQSKSRLLIVFAVFFGLLAFFLYLFARWVDDMSLFGFILLYLGVLSLGVSISSFCAARLGVFAQVTGLFATTLGILLFVGFSDPNNITGDPFGQYTLIPLDWLRDWIGQSTDPQDALAERYGWKFLFIEVANFFMVLMFPLIVLLFAFLFSTFKSLRDKYIASINNMTVANIAGYTAAATPLFVIAIAYLNHQAEDQWLDMYLGFPWFLCVMPVIYLGMVAQRMEILPENEPDAAPTVEQNAKLSLQPYYNSLTSNENIQPHNCDWMNIAKIAEEETPFGDSIRGDVKKLLEGEGLYFSGMADAGLYTLLSETIASIQDRGQMSLIICPDGAAGEVDKRLNQLSRFGFPEVTRRQTIWPDKIDKFSPSNYYDLIISEESSFHDQMGNSRANLGNITHRLALVVMLDFHLIDACRFYLSLRLLTNQDLPENVGMLAQSLDHIGMEAQLDSIVNHLPGKYQTAVECTLHPIPAEFGWIVWLTGQDLRQKLLDQAGFGDGNGNPNLMTAPYLMLIPQDNKPEENFSRAYQATRQHISDYKELKFALKNVHGKVERPNGKLYAMDEYFHFSPHNDVRIITRPDLGNLAQCFSGLNPFWGDAPDYLLHVTSSGYPGRQYMLDRLNNIKLTRGNLNNELEHLKPMAQMLGIGILEIAEQIGNALRDSRGLSEENAHTLLGLCAGKLSDYINVTPSKRGLKQLFRIVDPDFHQEISTTLDERLHERYSVRSAGGASYSFDSRVDVVATTAMDKPFGQLAMKDEGLTYHRQGIIFLEREFVHIDNIDEPNNRITAFTVARKDLTQKPQPVYFYQRHYRMLLKEIIGDDKEIATFVGENILSHSTSHGERYETALFQASIERQATNRFELSSDEEPVSGLKRGKGALTFKPLHRRPFRNVFFVAVNEMDYEFAGNEVLNRTLSASLQMVIGLAFPSLRQRIAVVSLNNSDDPKRAENCAANDLTFGLYPTGELVGMNLVELINKFYSIAETDVDTISSDDVEKMVGIAIIEDSDHDLGVARKVFESWDKILIRWDDFLDWATERDEWNRDQLFDAKAAKNFVEYLKSNGSPLSGEVS